MILHLIYQQAAYEGQAKDYDFSATSMRDHWDNGYRDTKTTLQRKDWLTMPSTDGGYWGMTCTASPTEPRRQPRGLSSAAPICKHSRPCARQSPSHLCAIHCSACCGWPTSSVPSACGCRIPARAG
ncbi:MAG TPA: DUF3734 domain-containing protein [Acetobacteraceae bacterium]|nr:DUF3734 domain-containing protein [Acetobacteraceae bacterium]